VTPPGACYNRAIDYKSKFFSPILNKKKLYCIDSSGSHEEWFKMKYGGKKYCVSVPSSDKIFSHKNKKKIMHKNYEFTVKNL